jgi:hypothetical protein
MWLVMHSSRIVQTRNSRGVTQSGADYGMARAEAIFVFPYPPLLVLLDSYTPPRSWRQGADTPHWVAYG